MAVTWLVEPLKMADNEEIPYILFLTPKQEIELRQIFMKKKWTVNKLFCVPSELKQVIVSVVQKIAKTLTWKGKKVEALPKKQYIIGNKKFQEVGIFDQMNSYIENTTTNSHAKDTVNVLSECKDSGSIKANTITDISNTIDARSCNQFKLMYGYKGEVLGIHADVELGKSRQDLEKLFADVPDHKDNVNVLLAEKDYTKLEKHTKLEKCKRLKKHTKLVTHTKLEEHKRLQDHSKLTECTKLVESTKLNACRIPNNLADTSMGFESDDTEQEIESVTEKNIDVNCECVSDGEDEEVDIREETVKCSKSDNKEQKLKNRKQNFPSAKTDTIMSSRYKRKKVYNLLERQNKYKCSICDKVMSSEKNFERHMERLHSDEALRKREDRKRQDEKKIHACLVCHKQFVDKNGLYSHIKNLHNDINPVFQCDLCGAIMKRKGSLVQHVKSVHTDKRPYHCDICDSKFKLYQQLKTHKRRHDPDYVETCTICGKTLKKGHLSTHMKRHTNNRKHRCLSCEKTFYEKQDLDRHTVIHLGEKPHKCPHCQYACAFKGNLSKHIKHKHEADSVANSRLVEKSYRLLKNVTYKNKSAKSNINYTTIDEKHKYEENKNVNKSEETGQFYPQIYESGCMSTVQINKICGSTDNHFVTVNQSRSSSGVEILQPPSHQDTDIHALTRPMNISDNSDGTTLYEMRPVEHFCDLDSMRSFDRPHSSVTPQIYQENYSKYLFTHSANFQEGCMQY